MMVCRQDEDVALVIRTTKALCLVVVSGLHLVGTTHLVVRLAGTLDADTKPTMLSTHAFLPLSRLRHSR